MSLIWHRRAALNTPWNPWGDPSLALRLDANKIELYDAGHLTKMPDLSGASRHATQSIVANMLTTWSTSDADFRGNGSVTFLNPQWLSTPDWVIAQPIAIYFVVKFGINSAQLVFDGKYGDGRMNAYGSGTSVFASAPTAISAAIDVRGLKVVGAAIFNGISSALYINSVTPAATGNAGSGGANGLNIGNGYTGVSNVPVGKMTSFSAFMALPDAATHARRLRWFGDKYGQVIA